MNMRRFTLPMKTSAGGGRHRLALLDLPSAWSSGPGRRGGAVDLIAALTWPVGGGMGITCSIPLLLRDNSRNGQVRPHLEPPTPAPQGPVLEAKRPSIPGPQDGQLRAHFGHRLGAPDFLKPDKAPQPWPIGLGGSRTFIGPRSWSPRDAAAAGGACRDDMVPMTDGAALR
jgi:hypothetical protein